MLTLNSRLSVPDHIHVTKVDGDTVLLNTRTSKYFALEEVGARIWDLLKEGQQPIDIHAALLGEYDVAPARLQQDILELLERLLANRLVELVQE